MWPRLVRPEPRDLVVLAVFAPMGFAGDTMLWWSHAGYAFLLRAIALLL